MPYALVEIGFQLILVIHIIRTGRDKMWLYVVLLLPVAGAIAYVICEIIPAMLGTPKGQRAIEQAKDLVDPEARLRERLARFEIAGTVANRQALADEYVRLGRFDEAIRHYRDALQGMHATDPDILAGLAAAQFGAERPVACLETLDHLRRHNPDFQSVEAHLLYARSLEAVGRTDEALTEYQTLVGYHAGAEAVCRFALLLKTVGRVDRAREELTRFVGYYERSPKFYQSREREWYDRARASLAE